AVRPAGGVRAVAVRAAARRGDVALVHGVAAHGPAGQERIGGARVGDAVAHLVEVAETGGGPADGGALGVGGAVDARAVAVLLEVADAGRETAGRPAGSDVIRGANVGDAVAEVVDVAETGGGPADGGALGVGGAVDPRAVAVLLQVTHAGREPAGGPGRGDVIGRAVVGDAVAHLVHVADTGRGPAHRGALRVRRAVDARAVAVFLGVPGAGRAAAGRARVDDVIGRTVVADAVAALRHVTDTGRGAADSRALGVVRA